MPVSDLDIHRAAHLLIAHHGDNATAVAREMVETMRQRGDAEGADTWLRIMSRSARWVRRQPIAGISVGIAASVTANGGNQR
jgi:hypothetical protein